MLQRKVKQITHLLYFTLVHPQSLPVLAQFLINNDKDKLSNLSKSSYI